MYSLFSLGVRITLEGGDELPLIAIGETTIRNMIKGSRVKNPGSR